jgi:DNA-binding SARP family transcriptional activator
VLRLTVFGGLSLQRDGSRLEGAAAQPKRLALLAALAASGGKGMAREKLMALLWPDADDERARRNLAQAVYALRQELGDDALQGGTWDLRLNDSIINADLADFEEARRSGALERAAGHYTGPFLEGFAASGSAEFDRWAESRRTELAHDAAAVLDGLIAQLEARGDDRAAVEWLRRRISFDPHDGKVAARLMLALARAGDPGSARGFARSFQAALAEDLGLPPDGEVESALRAIDRMPVQSHTAEMEIATRRQTPVSPIAPAMATSAGAGPVVQGPRRGLLTLLVAVVAVLVVGGALLARRMIRRPATIETVSIGRIADYRPSPREELIGPVGDLLATSLARSPALRVVSTARMYELLSRDTTRQQATSTLADIARLAGATQVVEGALYPLPDGRLMLDLRRVDLKSGEVLGVARAQAADAFSLVDSATAVLLSSLGAAVPAGSIAASTTASLAAYRLYEQGLRAWFRFDRPSAERLFLAALSEDSTFAMAAYYAARVSTRWPDMLARLHHVNRLADRTAERERLLIRAGTALMMSDPLLGVYADSLVTRYPEEVEGYYYAGSARNAFGDFLGSLPYYERVVTMDSIARFPTGIDCRACNALAGIFSSFIALDSLAAAERNIERWLRLLPNSPPAWQWYAEVLSITGRYDQAMVAARRYDSLSTPEPLARVQQGNNLIRQGLADSAAALLLAQSRLASGQELLETLWFRTIALREAGRGPEALEAAVRYRTVARGTSTVPAAQHSGALLQGIALESMGRMRDAAAVYDSAARWEFPDDFPSSAARRVTWVLTHAASALAAAGDTTRLARLADSIKVLGVRSGFGRDRLLHHHVRGLLWSARGQDSLAIEEFRAAIYSPTAGYTRTNLELGKIYLRRKQPREAIAVLEPALRGSVEASNLYAPRREIHALLAQAYIEIGDGDRAAIHRKIIGR